MDGHSLTCWHLKRLVKKVNDKAELEEKARAEQAPLTEKPVRLPENLRFHDLRHTCPASRSQSEGGQRDRQPP